MSWAMYLRDYLRERAGWVWNEQKHAFDRGLTLQEETLTEMLLLRMSKDHGKHGLVVRLFNKTEEARNGADWEWHVRTPSCDLALRVQAKRLYHRVKVTDYGGLNPNSGQTNKLITMAAAHSCIPVFVFFNHDCGSNSANFTSGGNAPFRGRSFWGCAIASAEQVKKQSTNTVAGLKSVLSPWHNLVSHSGRCSAVDLLGQPSEESETKMPPRPSEILEMIGNPEAMEDYTATAELAGVAVLDFSEFRGE